MSVVPRDSLRWGVRLRVDRRMDLHFHLEASDGAAYLESAGPDRSLGWLEVAPHRADEVRAWLQAVADDFGIEWVNEAGHLEAPAGSQV